jgi:hypothetical protein
MILKLEKLRQRNKLIDHRRETRGKESFFLLRRESVEFALDMRHMVMGRSCWVWRYARVVVQANDNSKQC